MDSFGKAYILGKEIKLSGDTSILNKIASNLLWFSYRLNFPKISPTNIITDSGWGCTIRTAQMLFANAILIHKHGKDFLTEEVNKIYETKFDIIQKFNDNEESIFSIHKITTLGQKFNVNIGSWHGPNMLASIFSQLFEQNSYDELKLYITNDGMIYKDQFYDSPNTESFLILVCMKLGKDSLNKIYIPSLQYLCKSGHFAGIIGGKPSSSYFFIGCQDNKIIYLDPHETQYYEYAQGSFSKDEQERILSTYSTAKFYLTTISQLDPSLTIAFYCKNNDLESFFEEIENLPLLENGSKVMMVMDKKPIYEDDGFTIEELNIDDF